MKYETPKCPVCKQTSDRCPLRLVGEVGIMFELSEDGKTVHPVHAYLYQCTGCRNLYMTYGLLKPTMNPLEEVPISPRPLREIPMSAMAQVTHEPPPGVHPRDVLAHHIDEGRIPLPPPDVVQVGGADIPVTKIEPDQPPEPVKPVEEKKQVVKKNGTPPRNAGRTKKN